MAQKNETEVSRQDPKGFLAFAIAAIIQAANVSKKHKERMQKRLTGIYSRCGGERADSVDEH